MTRTLQAMRYNRVAEYWEPCADGARGVRYDILRDGKVEFMNIKSRDEAEALAPPPLGPA